MKWFGIFLPSLLLATPSGRAQAEPLSPPPPPASSAPSAAAASSAGPVPATPSYIATVPHSLAVPEGFFVTGYVQAELRTDASSEDELSASGQPLNRDQFLVRRARLRGTHTTRHTSVVVELDGNTTRGPVVGLRRAEASLLLRSLDKSTDRLANDTVPLLALTAGLTQIPFGYELSDAPRNRLFFERTVGSLALFPGEPDVGARLSGGFSVFRYAVSAMNGHPLDERAPQNSRELDSAKDWVARLGFDVGAPKFRITGGSSFLRGKGFHQGSPATKASVTYRDLDENGRIDTGELTATPGSAAVRSQTFEHWAVGADLEVRLRTPIGWSMIFGEAFAAQNLDRGAAPADPVVTGIDQRELGYYVAALQDVRDRGIFGARYEVYDPNADFLDRRQGKLVPASQQITTTSLLAGLTIERRARLLFQVDFVRDFLARDARGVPVDARNNRAGLRLQVDL
jgi:hypothetical protein